jgi:hypothetical protein
MPILDATTRKIELKLGGAVTTNELDITGGYVDWDAPTVSVVEETPVLAQSNGATPVAIIDVPAGADTRRHGKELFVRNRDTVAATVIIQYNDNGTIYELGSWTLDPDDTLQYIDGDGWRVVSPTGGVKTSTVASPHNILSASHGDAVVAAVQAGDLLYGNGTPKWDRLGIAPNNRLLYVSGGLPAWSDSKLAYDGTDLTTPRILPATDNTYDHGTITNRVRAGYMTALHLLGAADSSIVETTTSFADGADKYHTVLANGRHNWFTDSADATAAFWIGGGSGTEGAGVLVWPQSPAFPARKTYMWSGANGPFAIGAGNVGLMDPDGLAGASWYMFDPSGAFAAFGIALTTFDAVIATTSNPGPVDGGIVMQPAGNYTHISNGFGAQLFTVANVGGTDYERFEVNWQSVSNVCNLWTKKDGSGSVRVMRLGIGGTGYWAIDTSGNYVAVTDAANDWGDATHRPRDLHLSRDLYLGGTSRYSVLSVGASDKVQGVSPNTTTTRKFLRQVGDGVNSADPAWDTIVVGDLPTFTLAGTANQVSLSASGANTILSRNITLSLPQDIHTGATPTFAGMTLTGNLLFSADATYDVGDATHRPRDLRLSRDIYLGGVAQWSVLSIGASSKVQGVSPNTTTTRKFLRQVGDGVSSADPAWDTIVVGDLPTFTLTGTANQVSLSASGANVLLSRDLTLSLPQNIHTGAAPQFAGLTLTGELVFSADATVDLGDATHRARNLWLSSLTSGRVTYATASGQLTDSANLLFDGTNLTLGSGSALKWSTDLILVRDGAGVIAQKDGVNAQTLRIYGTTTGPKYLALLHDGVEGVIQTNAGGGALVLNVQGTSYWQINTSGHWLAWTDNVSDFGATGASRPRSIYWGTQAFGPDGSAANPSYSFANSTSTGFYRLDASNVIYSISGAARILFGLNGQAEPGIYIGSTAVFGWDNGTVGSGNVVVKLYQNGTGILEQKNGTTAQEHRIYGTTTGPKYISTLHNGTDGYIDAHGRIFVATTNATSTRFGSPVYPQVDNTTDFGAASLRWASGYFSTALIVGTTPATAGLIRTPNATAINFRNQANGADYTLIESLTRNSVNDCVRVGGSSAGVIFAIRSKNGMPTTSDLLDGEAAVFRDTGRGEMYLWVNDGGTLVAAQLFVTSY